ncbi:(2Fe-2S) ferredoxin domain-containing protein [Acidaminobacter hydrogenoformans]|uniref:NAD(P)-dependent iron-only hydrogenase iron-sulfur protein n=1 Tax=Acidaminobacter hydrogenoformans DSM 2784 TaxID=1120920 RepID=A0A1G5RTU4_9FIRM|nr:(2Fe-2S) ferredoxin domain-containing protein [Acidaminobacter hydrogenoformans]SCZ77130.1 NAD(P)-dependent iron-only hydrogenase iron-sulfur protein [Acidaminobacter hydrogenoformans DSM 2784]
MKSLVELERIQQDVYKRINLRTLKGDYTVSVAVDDCGMAAGARQVLLTFLDEIEKQGLENIRVIQTGCLGDCSIEPVVEIFHEGEPKVTYVHMTEEKARQIVKEHLVNHQVVEAFTIGKLKK